MTRSITAVRPKARKRDRAVIYLDGEPALEVAAILALELKPGQALTEDNIQDLERRDLEERTLQNGLALLRRRPHTEKELRLRMSQRRVPKEVQDAVLSTLRERGHLDDQAFAREWIDNRRDFRPRGVRALRFEMLGKGVPREIVEESLRGYDEESAALDAGLRYARRLRGLSTEEFRGRLQAHLSRRGFDRDVVEVVVERVREEIPETTGEDRSEVLT